MKSTKNIFLLWCCMLAAPFALDAKVLTTAQAQKNLNDAVAAFKKDQNNADLGQNVLNSYAVIRSPQMKVAANGVLQKQLGMNINQVKNVVLNAEKAEIIKANPKISEADAQAEAEVQTFIDESNFILKFLKNKDAIDGTPFKDLEEYKALIDQISVELSAQKTKNKLLAELTKLETSINTQSAAVKAHLAELAQAQAQVTAPAPTVNTKKIDNDAAELLIKQLTNYNNNPNEIKTSSLENTIKKFNNDNRRPNTDPEILEDLDKKIAEFEKKKVQAATAPAQVQADGPTVNTKKFDNDAAELLIKQLTNYNNNPNQMQTSPLKKAIENFNNNNNLRSNTDPEILKDLDKKIAEFELKKEQAATAPAPVTTPASIVVNQLNAEGIKTESDNLTKIESRVKEFQKNPAANKPEAIRSWIGAAERSKKLMEGQKNKTSAINALFDAATEAYNQLNLLLSQANGVGIPVTTPAPAPVPATASAIDAKVKEGVDQWMEIHETSHLDPLRNAFNLPESNEKEIIFKISKLNYQFDANDILTGFTDTINYFKKNANEATQDYVTQEFSKIQQKAKDLIAKANAKVLELQSKLKEMKALEAPPVAPVQAPIVATGAGKVVVNGVEISEKMFENDDAAMVADKLSKLQDEDIKLHKAKIVKALTDKIKATPDDAQKNLIDLELQEVNAL